MKINSIYLSLSPPSAPKIEAFLTREARLDYSYTAVGASRTKGPADYDNDYRSVLLGKGEALWEAAKAALDAWQQFPEPWTRVLPANSPLEEGQNVAVLFRIWGIWFTNSARIVYTLDEPNRYGFAYGTLPGHVEEGEECFWIERDEEGMISYHIRAFSKPRFWLARLGYPFARWYQRRFVRQSMQIMAALNPKNH